MNFNELKSKGKFDFMDFWVEIELKKSYFKCTDKL